MLGRLRIEEAANGCVPLICGDGSDKLDTGILVWPRFSRSFAMSRWSVSASHVGPPSLIPQNRSQRTLIPGTLRHTGKISAISPASRSRQFFRQLAAHRGCSSPPGRRAAKWAISGPAAARDTSWAAKAKRPPTSDNISNDVSLSTEIPDAMQEKPVQILGIHDLRTARGSTDRAVTA